MDVLKEYYHNLPESQQLPLLLTIVMSPTVFVYLLIFLTRLEKLRFRKQIIRLGVAFGMGAMLGDLTSHISMDLFKSVLGVAGNEEHNHDHGHAHGHHHQ